MMNNNDVYLHMVSLLIIFAFSIIYSAIQILNTKNNFFIRIISLFVLISSIYISMNRNVYLPFLGTSVLPPILFMEDKVPSNATEKYILELNGVPDETKVIYWGSLPNKDKNFIHKNPLVAYGDYSNTGIATVKNQKAIIYYHCPTKYNVTMYNKTIDRHIHYRLVYKNNPMIGTVMTKYIKC